MLAWGTIIYGAVLAGAFGAAFVALVPRYLWPELLLVVASGTAAGTAAWNTILRAARIDHFFVDAPLSSFPISWQDAGSGLFVLAVLGVLLRVGPLRAAPARESVTCALLAALVALVADVYLY